MKIRNLVLVVMLAIAFIFSTLLSLMSLRSEINQLKNTLEIVNKRLLYLESKNFDFIKISAEAKKAVVMLPKGTGFLYGRPDRVVVPFHVIAGSLPDKTVEVFPNDGVHILIRGEIEFAKQDWDLAIIKLEKPIDAAPLMPADVVKLTGGEIILVIGNPEGLKNSLSNGIISAIGIRRSPPYTPLIQITGTVDGGSSGSPVINKDGKVIGMVVRSLPNITFSFAVPIDKVDQLISEGGAP